MTNNHGCTIFCIVGYSLFESFILFRTKPFRFKHYQAQKFITLSLFEAYMQNQCWFLIAAALLYQNISFVFLFVLYFQFYITKFHVCYEPLNCRKCNRVKLGYVILKYAAL